MDTTHKPRLCLDIFESNANGFIGELTSKIATIQGMKANAQDGGDFHHTLDRYQAMLESAKIAAKAHRDISLRDNHG